MLEFKIDFPDALIDIDRKITISGAPADSDVIIRSKTERAGQVWRSQITVKSNESGEVDLAVSIPTSGSYTAANPMGLIYAQQAENAATQELFHSSVHHALHTELEAQCNELEAKTVLTQRLAQDAVQRVEINEAGLKGVLFIPASSAAQPAVIVLKRHADQPLDESQAALYASRGYAAFALDYELMPDVSATTEQLAYFSHAFDWLRGKISPKNHFVAVSGYEDGAELALVVGVQFAAKVSAVIACEATAEVLQPYPLAVEALQGPLLLASGQQHSASAYYQSIGERLEQHGFDYNFQWYDFEGVAGGLQFPHVPTTLHANNTAQVLALAQANKALWFSIIGFLHQAVAEAAAGKPND